MISIASWNAQGNPLEDPLGESFLGFLLAEHDVVVLQSCGALVDASFAAFRSLSVGRLRCSARGFRQPSSVDPFCSVAILSRLGSAFPLEGGTLFDPALPGRFGVCCEIPAGPRGLVLAAFQASPSGMGRSDWARFAGDLVRAAGTGERPIIAAVEPGRDWNGGGGFDLLDTRTGPYVSPGRRRDSFLVRACRADPDFTVLDCGGASDHDAVSARFG